MPKKFIYVCIGILVLVFHLGATTLTAQTEGCVLLMDGQSYYYYDAYVESYAALVYQNGDWHVAFRYSRQADSLGHCSDCSWSVNLPLPRSGEDWNIVRLSSVGAGWSEIAEALLYYSDGKVYRSAGVTVPCVGGTTCTPPSGWELEYDLGYTGACWTYHRGWPIGGGDSAAVVGNDHVDASQLENWLVNNPNPFSYSTMINFRLEYKDHVKVEIYNARGQRVRTLLDAHMLPGDHSLFWDGQDEHGNQVGPGVYFSRVSTGRGSDTQKMIRLQ